METTKNKPLGGKAYGSVPHLPGSRLGMGDHHCHPGQAAICTEKVRDRHDHIVVQEKLDGSNVCVALIEGSVVPLTRAGYRAESSQFSQHHLFAEWVNGRKQRFYDVLREGERLCGEWLAQAHGTRYALPHEPFVAFDIMQGHQRMPYIEFTKAAARGSFTIPRLIHEGGPFSIESALRELEQSGHGALDPVEGAVWRVERRGVVEFLAKYVRPYKVDGLYLPERSGLDAVWNWLPDNEDAERVD